MASEPLRVVCYVNQFFGQIGGEEKAGIGPQVMNGAVGAARAVQQALGDGGTVVATVNCGDNYAVEQGERAVAELLTLVAAARPDLVIAGPAFLAGRYGVACGALCVAVQAQLGIPAVTGMQPENPGVDLYRRRVYVVQTARHGAQRRCHVVRVPRNDGPISAPHRPPQGLCQRPVRRWISASPGDPARSGPAH